MLQDAAVCMSVLGIMPILIPQQGHDSIGERLPALTLDLPNIAAMKLFVLLAFFSDAGDTTASALIVSCDMLAKEGAEDRQVLALVGGSGPFLGTSLSDASDCHICQLQTITGLARDGY